MTLKLASYSIFMHRVFIACVLASVALIAQEPPEAKPARVSGPVRRADTGGPLAKAICDAASDCVKRGVRGFGRE